MSEIPIGIQGFDLTTGMNLLNPRITFQLADYLNRTLSLETPVGIEIYVARKPFDITAKKVAMWQKQFPKAYVSRVHGEFRVDNDELNDNYQKTPRWKRPRSRALNLLFDTFDKRTGVSLARELGVGMNIHGNIGAYLLKEDLMEEFKERLPFVLIENANRDQSFHDPAMTRMSDPRYLVEHMIGKGKTDGLLLGIDHLMELGIDSLPLLENKEIQRTIRAIHFRDPKHLAIKRGNEPHERIIRKLAVMPHDSGELRVALDYNPLAYLPSTLNQQSKSIADTLEWFGELQSDEQAKLAA